MENKICEGTDHLKAAIRCNMTSLQVIFASARSVVCIMFVCVYLVLS